MKRKLQRNGCTLDFFLFKMFFLHLCLSNWPCQPAQQHHWAPPQPPFPRNSSWGLIYFDIWRDLILMPTKNEKKIAKFWNAWAVRSNWCDSGKQKEQASKQTNKPKSKNALTECGLTPNIVHNNNHNVQETAPERQQPFFFFIIFAAKTRTCDFN